MRSAKFVAVALTVLAMTLFTLGQILSYESNVPFRSVIFDYSYWQSTPLSVVINDNATWSRVWNHALCGGPCSLGTATAPLINFDNTTLLAVLAGNPPNLGTLTIVQVGQTHLGLIVTAVLVKLEPNCLLIRSIEASKPASPFNIVAIPKTTEPVAFLTQTIVKNCSYV